MKLHRIVPAAAAVALACAATALSEPGKTAVTGTWSTTPPVPTDILAAGVNVKVPATLVSTWAGDLSGTTVVTATFLVHPDGRIVAAPSREILTGSVAGYGNGTLDLTEEAHAGADGSTQIDGTIVRGTGDLAGLHGRLVFVGTCDASGACAGTYSGLLN